MTDWTMQSSVEDPQILSKRLGAFVRRQGSAKEIANLIECDVRTAEQIRAGKTWPIARHWLAIWVTFGEDVLEAVFYPERALQRLQREEAAREEARLGRIAALSAQRDDRSFAPRGRQARARHEDRAAALITPD